MRSALRTRLAGTRLAEARRARQARRELSPLQGGHPAAAAVGVALTDALEARVDADERAWIDRIEALRADLNASTTELSFVDYGAGSREDQVTEDNPATPKTKTVGEIARGTSKPPPWALVLFKLVRHLRPSVSLELGSSVGVSSAYQAAALELNSAGRLVTLEGAESVARLAEENLSALGLPRANVVVGRFQDVLDDVLRENEPIDYAFIDGHHLKTATLNYFDQIVRHASKGAVVVVDDIAWSDGMREAWREIASRPDVTAAVDLGPLGVCVVGEAGEKIGVAARRFRGVMLERHARAGLETAVARDGAG